MSVSRKPSPDTGGGDAAVRAVAREIAELRSTVDAFTEQSTAAAEAASSALKATKTLAETIEKLRTRTPADGSSDSEGRPPHAVASGVAPPPGDGTPAAPWWTVNDSDVAQARLTDLTEWIGAVYVRYLTATDEFRACWAYHADVVTELLTLRDTYHAVYYGPAASPQAVQDWHDRYRPGTVQRVTKALRGCGLAKHTTQAYTPPRPPGGELVDDIATWWSNTQGQTAPPPPPPDALAGEQAARSMSDMNDY